MNPAGIELKPLWDDEKEKLAEGILALLINEPHRYLEINTLAMRMRVLGFWGPDSRCLWNTLQEMESDARLDIVQTPDTIVKGKFHTFITLPRPRAKMTLTKKKKMM